MKIMEIGDYRYLDLMEIESDFIKSELKSQYCINCGRRIHQEVYLPVWYVYTSKHKVVWWHHRMTINIMQENGEIIEKTIRCDAITNIFAIPNELKIKFNKLKY